MRDQYELALKCLEAERRGASVHDFLRGMGFISPKATWERLQLNELGRKADDLNDGKEDPNMKKLTETQEKKAIEIAKKGTSPISYLELTCGIANGPQCWAKVKNRLKESDPETWEKVKDIPKSKAGRKPAAKKPEVELVYDPSIAEEYRKEQEAKTAGEAMENCEKAAEDFFGACEGMGLLKQEKKYVFAPDGEHLMKITEPLKYNGFTVDAIRRDYGRYERDTFNGKVYLTYETLEGEEISMPVDMWKEFIVELREAANLLGVSLDG